MSFGTIGFPPIASIIPARLPKSTFGLGEPQLRPVMGGQDTNVPSSAGGTYSPIQFYPFNIAPSGQIV